jgi:hypothetical protein
LGKGGGVVVVVVVVVVRQSEGRRGKRIFLYRDNVYTHQQKHNIKPCNIKRVALGDLVVAYFLLDPRFLGSNPAEDDRIFKGDKNLKHNFIRSGSKAVGHVS